MDDKTILLIMFVFSGMLIVGLSIPLILIKIGPNGLYGFRIKKTMENPEIWYPVNNYSGKWLLLTGCVISVAAIGLKFLEKLNLDVYALCILAISSLVFIIGLIFSVRFINKLN